jgi:seryl-tRNA synthetase
MLFCGHMLDLQFIRENEDIVRAALKNKNREGTVDLKRVLELAEERKLAAASIADINRRRKLAADARDAETGKQLKEESKVAEERYAELEKELVPLLIKIPNIPSADTPVGPDESGNVVIKQWGEKREFDFEPKAHWDLGRELGIIDSEKAAEVSGARFTYLKGDLALMQFALIQLVMSVLTSRDELAKIIKEWNLSVSDKPFIPVVPPVIVKKQVQIRMARYLTPEEHYLFPEDDTMLVGSADGRDHRGREIAHPLHRVLDRLSPRGWQLRQGYARDFAPASVR